MARPWAYAGYDCVCYDLAHSIRRDRVVGNVTYRWADVRSLTIADFPGEPSFVFAFPPCTNLAVSGARDFQRKGMRGLFDGLETVEACRVLCESSRAPWGLENPVSRLSSCWRKPDHTFDPWQYGDNYTKKTCVWSGNGFVMPEPTVDKKHDDVDDRIHKSPPSADWAAICSKTPPGFATAVFEANHNG
mgnify:CR=1 FL=1